MAKQNNRFKSLKRFHLFDNYHYLYKIKDYEDVYTQKDRSYSRKLFKDGDIIKDRTQYLCWHQDGWRRVSVGSIGGQRIYREMNNYNVMGVRRSATLNGAPCLDTIDFNGVYA